MFNKKPLIVLIASPILILGFLFFAKKTELTNWFSSRTLPTPVKYEKVQASPKATPGLIEYINLDIPFTSQAPHLNWNQPYQDFCEEASVLMAVQYVNGGGIANADFADSKMLAIMDFEIKKFGYYKDTNTEQVALILREFYGITSVKVVYDPTIGDIKKALVEKRAVVVPAAGRQLYNPYFTPPGPQYHMLIIKGFTKDNKLITNDPGTRRGADFIYKQEVLMNAIHDWNGGDVDHGRKVMIVVG